MFEAADSGRRLCPVPCPRSAESSGTARLRGGRWEAEARSLPTASPRAGRHGGGQHGGG